MNTTFVSVRGLPIAVHDRGAGENTVVFIHGFLDHGRSFEPVVELDSGYRALLVDMRGHGESGWVGSGGYYHFYDYFHDVLTVLAKMEVHRPFLVGHSMGGSIALGVSALTEVAGLLLLEGVGPPFTDLSETPQRLSRWSRVLSQPDLAADVEGRRRSRRPIQDVEEAAQRMRRYNPRLAHAASLRLAETLTEASGEDRVWRSDPLHRTPPAKPYLENEAHALWHQVQCPVLSLYAEHGMVPPDLHDRHGQFQNLTSGWIPGCGHNIHHEQPQLVASCVRALVEGTMELPTGVVVQLA